MKKSMSKQILGFLVFIILSSTVIIGGSFYFINSTNEDVNVLNQKFLGEIASQNASIMKKTVQTHLDKLSAIANIIGNAEKFSTTSTLKILSSESTRSSFKRMGYADTKGWAVTSDGQAFSIANRSYFKNAIKGIDNVSDRLVDKVGGDFINVYAVPMYRNDKIAGVVFATNRNTDFIDLVSAETFDGEGFSYVIKKDGTPIAYPKKSAKTSSDLVSLFEEIDNTLDGKGKVDEIMHTMQQEEDGILTYTWKGIDRVGAYCKVGIEDWYAVTLVPKTVITANSDRIVMRNIAIVVLTAFTFIIFLAFIILQNRKSQKSLEKIAYIDELTGSMNFHAFKKVAQKLLQENKTESYVFVKFDVENFKFINDRLGFKAGDEVLRNIADGLKEILSAENEAYARIAADEYICMLKEKHENFLPEIRETFVNTFDRLMGSDFNHLIRFHSGIYKVEKDEKDINSIYEKVNYAHRQAKLMNLEGDIVEFFYDDAVRAEAKRRIEIEDHMAMAIKQESFVVYIQPKYSLSSETIAGGEALVRWRQSDGSLLYPNSFIPLFEENGFIIKLDMYMFEQVCKILHTWIKEDAPLVRISVNFSRLHLFSANFVEELINISDTYRVPREYIELELTETIFFENQGLLENVLEKAHEAGFTVSMDDFGNGYSSLGLLKNINVDVIKVDRNFFVDDKDEERTKVVVEYVMKMAQKLGVHTLAEGIETKEHITMLKEFGCEYVQGYYYAKPMPVEQFEKDLYKQVLKNEKTSIL